MVSIRFLLKEAWKTLLNRDIFDQSLSSLSSLQLGDRCSAPEKCQCFQNKITDIWEYLEIFIPALLGSGYLLAYLRVWAQSILLPPQHEDCLEAGARWLHSFHLLRLQTITALPSSSSPPHRISHTDWLFLHLHTASTRAGNKGPHEAS